MACEINLLYLTVKVAILACGTRNNFPHFLTWGKMLSGIHYFKIFKLVFKILAGLNLNLFKKQVLLYFKISNYDETFSFNMKPLFTRI